MNIVTTRFGLIQASETELIRIPEGLLGFRSFTQYIHLPDPEVAGLSWLQSVTASDLAFALVAPPLAVSDYRIEIRPGDRAALELEDERTALIYVILNRAFGGRPHRQPPGAAGVQSGASPGPAARPDIQPVSGPVPAGVAVHRPGPDPAAGPDTVACNGLTRRSLTQIPLVVQPSPAPS